jgi:hypothetical protein
MRSKQEGHRGLKECWTVYNVGSVQSQELKGEVIDESSKNEVEVLYERPSKQIDGNSNPH